MNMQILPQPFISLALPHLLSKNVGGFGLHTCMYIHVYIHVIELCPWNIA